MIQNTLKVGDLIQISDDLIDLAETEANNLRAYVLLKVQGKKGKVIKIKGNLCQVFIGTAYKNVFHDGYKITIPCEYLHKIVN